jgi:hypothetical protein
MMLGYVHNTTKIWRIWDFNSGRNGRAVECSSVVFQEEENAHGKSTKEPTEGIEFPDTEEELYDEFHEVEEINKMEMNDSSRLQDSKSKTPSLRCHQRVGSTMCCWVELRCH